MKKKNKELEEQSARNLGFTVDKSNFDEISNIETGKTINVEVARLRNWIQTKEDIVKEFDAEMASGAEKYFKINKNILLNTCNLPLLTERIA